MDREPSKVLNIARKSFEEKDYSKALEKYEWFFENSILIDKSYIGVRLSYCLNEWADLAKKYSPAMEALVKQKNSALNHFKKTNSASSFNDYACICDYLECSEETITLFKEIHNTNKNLAKKIFRYVYEPLARNNEWKICGEYLNDSVKKYESSIIELFDYTLEFVKEKGGEEGEYVEKDLIEKTKEECLWLLNMNYHSSNQNKYMELLTKMKSDLENRGYKNLYKEILDDAPKWPK